MEVELSFYRHSEITALLVEGSLARPENLIINVLLAGLILRYSRGSNSRANPQIFPKDLMMSLCRPWPYKPKTTSGYGPVYLELNA
jgi:hypothetical protein